MNSVLNPGATLLGEGTVLVCRVEDRRGISGLTVARSTDGVSNWVLDPAPLHGPWNPAGGHVHGPRGPTGVYAITQQSSSYPDWLLPDLRNGPFWNGPRWPGPGVGFRRWNLRIRR